MKATEAKFLNFIQKSPQFVIPIYQRAYSWTERECRQLWDDILRTGRNDKISAHFVGSIVYIEKGLYQITSQSPLLVIDGQQRLTTLSLIIAALVNHLNTLPEEKRQPIDDFTPRKLNNYYLLNPEEEGERHYKLILSQTDKDSLIAIIDGKEKPRAHSYRIFENYELFEKWIADCGDDLVALCKGIAKLVVVDIALSRDQDNPQLIFESMNSTGRELTQADLIRNFILMGLEPETQKQLYLDYWRPMEVDFGQDAYERHFDGFMRHYLIVKTDNIPRLGDVYDAFKNYARSPKVLSASVEALVKDIREFARYYCAIAIGAESDPELKQVFHDLRELKVDVATPLLLELYHDYVHNLLPKEELIEAVRMVESYVFRRAVCSIPTNSMNKTFAVFSKALKKDRYLESLQAHFLLLPSYRRFPNDEEFKREFQLRDLYNFRSRSYWLRRMENHNRKERVVVDEYTIEHILPQNENLSKAWMEELGPDWQRIRDTYLHTLGNLTLTGYNPEYSDRPFIKKRDMTGGFSESPLKLNKGLGQLGHWNEDKIKERSDNLSNLALNVWRMPKLSSDILEVYRKKTSSAAEYGIDDHPYLLKSPVKELFEAFRAKVLELDPCVTEEFLKLYVAYKAETNFVDVVPQSKRLRLSLNMQFNEIHDPKGYCKNVAGLGRWGNGEVEVILSSQEDLPYVLGLIRQSFEKQMGNGESL